jgi:hypothetical protein
MAVVSPVPFALALVGALALFAAWLPSAIAQSRSPVRWREQPRPQPVFGRLPAATLTPVPTPADPPPPPRSPPHTPFRRPTFRVALVISVFVVWSVWATGRPHRPDSGPPAAPNH